MTQLSNLNNSSAVTANSDFSVLDGVGFVSQSALARMCGTTQGVISGAISRNSSYAIGWILNENNQLDAKSAYNAIVYFATQGKSEAIATLAEIGEAGMQAYIYTKAGYEISVKPKEEPKKEPEIVIPNVTSNIARPLLPEEKTLALMLVYKSVLNECNVLGNQALISSSQAAERKTGINLLTEVGMTHLTAEIQERYYTPTEIGLEIGQSSISANKALEALAYQVKDKSKKWSPVGPGLDISFWQDTGKRQGNGTPILQLKWRKPVLDILRNYFQN